MYLNIHGTRINTAFIMFVERDHSMRKASIQVYGWREPFVTTVPAALQAIDQYLEMAEFQGADQMAIMQEVSSLTRSTPVRHSAQPPTKRRRKR